MTTKHLGIAAAVTLPLLVVLGIVWYFTLAREYNAWEEVAMQHDRGNILVKHRHSARIYHGHPHVFGFGGGDIWHQIEFTIDGVHHHWAAPFRPIALHRIDERIWLVVFDRETDFSRCDFRCYSCLVKSPRSWIEERTTSLPATAAWQNQWLADRERFAVDQMTELTAKLRKSIATGLPYHQLP